MRNALGHDCWELDIPLETAYQMALSNQLPDAKTQLGVLRTWALVQAGQL